MNFKTLDLNLLRVLDALLAEGTTVGAGARLGLSQPAVSAALSRLRHALGDPLFVRRGRRLEPTDYASGLEAPLRRALDGLEAMLAGPEFDPAAARASFKITGSDFFVDLLMPQLAERLSRDAPGVRAQLVDLIPPDHVRSIIRQEADLGLFPAEPLPDWAEGRPVFNSSFAVIARRGHPRLAGIPDGSEMPLDLFCDLRHVLFSPEGNLQAMGDAALARIGRRREVAMTLPVFGGVCRAVARSDLVALLPRQMGLSMAPQVGLRVFRPPMEVPTATIWAVWPRRAANNPAHRWFRELVFELLAPLNAGEPPLPEGPAQPSAA